MTLVPHWRRVLLLAWSLWVVYGSILLEIAIQLLPFVQERMPDWAPVALLVLAIPFRIVEQRRTHAEDKTDSDPSRIRTHRIRRRRFGQWLRRNLPWAGARAGRRRAGDPDHAAVGRAASGRLSRPHSD
jgi:hypothetical protein